MDRNVRNVLPPLASSRAGAASGISASSHFGNGQDSVMGSHQMQQPGAGAGAYSTYAPSSYSAYPSSSSHAHPEPAVAGASSSSGMMGSPLPPPPQMPVTNSPLSGMHHPHSHSYQHQRTGSAAAGGVGTNTLSELANASSSYYAHVHSHSHPAHHYATTAHAHNASSPSLGLTYGSHRPRHEALSRTGSTDATAAAGYPILPALAHAAHHHTPYATAAPTADQHMRPHPPSQAAAVGAPPAEDTSSEATSSAKSEKRGRKRNAAAANETTGKGAGSSKEKGKGKGSKAKAGAPAQATSAAAAAAAASLAAGVMTTKTESTTTPNDSKDASAMALSKSTLPLEEIRPYRSRKNRPCDFCRSRKSRCVVYNTDAPCYLCGLNGRACTFLGPTTKRLRPPSSAPVARGGKAKLKDASKKGKQAINGPGKVGKKHKKGVEKGKGAVAGGEDEETPADASENEGSDQEEDDEEEDDEEEENLPEHTQANGKGKSRAILSRGRRKAVKLDGVSSSWRVGASGDAKGGSTAALHALINALVTGEEEEDDEYGASDNEEGTSVHGAHGTAGAVEGGEEQPTPFVMGSSSSADPVLQQAVHAFRHENGLYNDASESIEGRGETSSGAHARRKSSSAVVAGKDAVEAVNGQTGVDGAEAGAAPADVRNSAEGQPDATRTGAAEGAPGRVVEPNMDPLFPSSSKPPFPPLEVRRVTQDSSSRAVFFAFIDNPYSKGDRGANVLGKEGYEKLKEAIKGRRRQFMELYATRDAVAFPILSHSQRHEYRKAIKDASKSFEEEPNIPLPTLLAHASLATASVYDPSTRKVGKQAWADHLAALKQQFDFVSILTLQAALTDLCGRPSINQSGNYKTIASTYTICHMLGLHIDCSTWKFTKHERDLRIRIWWALYIHDKMSSLCWGKPSMIQKRDFSTPLPNRRNSPCAEHLADEELSSFEFDLAYEIRQNVHTPGDTFVSLAKLTIILDEILSEFHSARGYLQERDAYFVAKKVKAYMMDLEDWKTALPMTLRDVFEDFAPGNLFASDTKLATAWKVPGTKSLVLSYFGVLLLLCRTSLDSVTGADTFDPSRVMPAHRAALHSSIMLTEFMESLDAADFQGFWLHYGSHHLSTCVSLLARLALGFSGMEEPELLTSCSEVLYRLIDVLHNAFKLHQWDLANLSLARCRVILPALQSRIPEFAELPLHLHEALHPPAADESRPSHPANSQTHVGSANASGSHDGNAFSSFGLFDGRPVSQSGAPSTGHLQGSTVPVTDGTYNANFMDLDWRTMGLADNMEGWMPLDVGLGLGEIGVLFKGQNGLG